MLPLQSAFPEQNKAFEEAFLFDKCADYHYQLLTHQHRNKRLGNHRVEYAPLRFQHWTCCFLAVYQSWFIAAQSKKCYQCLGTSTCATNCRTGNASTHPVQARQGAQCMVKADATEQKSISGIAIIRDLCSKSVVALISCLCTVAI